MTKKTITKKAIPKRAPSKQDLLMQIEELRSWLEEAHQALRAIQSGESVTAAQALAQAHDELSERVKELTALTDTACILQDESKTVPAAMQAIVGLIPLAMQYPEIAAARIILDDQEFTTPNFAISRQSLWSDWTVNGQRGIVEVYYLEQRPPQAQGPFLAEEKTLINTLAEMLQAYVQRRQAQQDLYQAYAELETRVEERTAELREANETAQEYAEQLRTANEELREQAEEMEVTIEELAAQNEELRAARQQIEMERQRYQGLFDFAPGGYLVTDARGTIREANRAAAEMLNVRADRLEGKPLTVFVDEQEHRTLYAQLAQLQQAQGTLQWEMRLQQREGAAFPALITVTSMHDAQGQLAGLRWLLRDITERKRVEDALRVSVTKYQVLFESFPLGITIADKAGNVLESNKEAERLLGLTREEHTQRRIDGAEWRIIRPDGSSMLPEEYASVCALRENRLIDNVEMGIVKGAGQVTWISVTAAPIPLEGYGVAIAYGDITARKRAQEALHESEERYRTLFETMAQGVVYQDADGKVTLSNPAAERILGLTLDQMQGRTSTDLRWKSVHEDGSDFPGETHPAMVALRTGARVENVVMGIFNPQAQDYRWASIDAVPQFKPGEGKPYQVYTTFDDITERKRAEEALRESETRFRSAFDDSAVAMALTAPDLRLLRVNPAYCKLTGFDESELVGHSVLEWTHPDDTGLTHRALDSVVKDKQPTLRFEKRYIARDGRLLWVDVSSAPMCDTQGNMLYMVTHVQDITERKLAELVLRRLNRTLRARSHSDQALVRAVNEAEYMQEVCKIIIEDCGHAMVWVGFAEEDRAKSIRPVAYAGFEEGYLETLHLTWADTERGNGPTGTAIRTGQPSFCRNMLTDSKFAPWRAEALKRGYASSLVLPLLDDNKAFGAISIYFREPDPFTGDEVTLLSGLANDLAYGIKILRLRAAHAQAEAALRASEERYRTLFEGMTEGFALHEIICDEQGQPCDYRFLEINPSFERMTGLKREDVFGKAHNEVLPDDSPLWAQMYGQVALTGQPVHFDNYSPALKRHYEVFAYRPAPRQFAVLFMDITERKQMEEALRATNEELTRFNRAMVGRELRMIELKKEVNELCEQAGQPLRYSLDFEK